MALEVVVDLVVLFFSYFYLGRLVGTCRSGSISRRV